LPDRRSRVNWRRRSREVLLRTILGKWSDYPSRDFPARACRSSPGSQSGESVANHWKITQENSLGQTSVRNCARIYFLAKGSKGRRRRALLRSRTTIRLREGRTLTATYDLARQSFTISVVPKNQSGKRHWEDGFVANFNIQKLTRTC